MENMLSLNLLIEAIIIGAVFTIVSALAMIPVQYYFPSPEFGPAKYYITTFIVGMGIHYSFEIIGGNKWYCENGNACIHRN
jgi:hypothetical protein